MVREADIAKQQHGRKGGGNGYGYKQKESVGAGL